MPQRGHPHDAAAARVEDWLLVRAIPFWTSRAFDDSGLAHEELDFHGLPRETGYRRSMVQFRQVIVIAHAALAGHCAPRLAIDLFERVAERAWHPEGGWIHRLDREGEVLDETRDLYDQAFALLACAWLYALEREPAYLVWAERTLRFLDVRMAEPSGGYAEALPQRQPRRQNPHMHLFEALLALYEVSAEAAFLAGAERLLGLATQTFVTSDGALREYFGPAWEELATSHGDVVEPGHHFEWVWLLHQYTRLGGCGAEPLRAQLFTFAARHGLNDEGLAIEQVTTGGVPLSRGVKLWALTEQLKALVAEAEARGVSYDPRIDVVVTSIIGGYLCHEQVPLWYEGRSEAGQPDVRRMPVSTLYHLTVSFTELLRWTGALPRLLRGRKA